MNSKFNGWFNANELVQQSMATLDTMQEDNYNELLPIYKYAAVDNADPVKADLDEAIKKVSVVVTLHKYSDWSDDCYLLIGKALYLKKDYEAAENAFEFYMQEFLPSGKRTSVRDKKHHTSAGAASREAKSNAKAANKRQKELKKARKKAERERKAYNKEVKKRKKKGKSTDDLVRPGTVKAPDGTTAVPLSDTKKYEPTKAEQRAKRKEDGEMHGLFYHESVYDEAILWLAKSYIERENWTSADYQFRRLETDDILPPKVYEELPVARAYYHMKRENYAQVIPFLQQAIERAKKRANKARYAYIIAQLYYRQGEIDKAREFYQNSLDFANNYNMEFNTRLSIIRTGFKTHTITRADAQAQLEKMAKDVKNVNYLGRIYYVMATMAVDEEDITSAIDYLEKSVAEVGQDRFQEIESQYLLATLYMQKQKYVDADGAYKACAAIMKNTDPRYAQVKKLADNLTDIALNLNVIDLQDSLLRLSYMTDDQLKEIAKQIKKKEQEEAQAAEAKSKYQANAAKKNAPPTLAAGNNLGALPVNRQNPNEPTTALFWAFDQKNIKKGKREFEKTWGDIHLTDYWGVASRASQYATIADEVTQPNEAGVDLYASDLQDYFKDVPKTDSARALCHTQIRKSMLLLGQLYRDRLEDFQSSIKILESILEKYPDAPEKLEIYYQLYLSALSAGDHERSEKYKAMIISQYPSSRFAKVLSDPNFAATQQSEMDRLEQYYDETYSFFEKGNHEEVLNRIRGVEDKFGANNIIMGKFELLKAMSLGAQIGKEAYVDALKYIVARYPNSDEQKKAQDMLLLLGDSDSSKGYGETGLSTAKFIVEENALHFVIVYIENQDAVSVNDAKVAISEFNKKYFQLDNLKESNLVFDPAKNESLVLVRSFTTKDRAMNYYDTATRNPNDFLPKSAVFQVYPITQKNYREVIKARSLDSYKEFFEANYLKK
jgi:outer membrane protein assembly factor BamD (BamD/ComL family)